MKPTAPSMVAYYRQNSLNTKRAIPQMSWKPANLFNIWQRTSRDSPLSRDIDFQRSSRSLYQQRWMAKRMLKGYHAGFMGTTKFERWFLPERLPAIHAERSTIQQPSAGRAIEGRDRAGGRTRTSRYETKKSEGARAPVGSLMYQKVERRLDVLIFRSCFASSIYNAKHMVIGGGVKLNGQTVKNPNTLLNPGDLFTVNPKLISFLQEPKAEDKLSPQLEAAIDGAEAPAAEETTETSAEASADEAASAEAGEKAEATEEKTAGDTNTAASSSESAATAKKPLREVKLAPAPARSWFNLPPYAQAHIFVPAYIQPSFLTCSAVYVRHPTARPGYSEIATPFDGGGELMSLGWEWYSKKAPRMRSKVWRWWDPWRTKDKAIIKRSTK